MLLIDRYLLRQFFTVFGICFCSLAGLYVVADALGHLEEFINAGAKSGGLAAVMAEYYGYRLISFFDRTSGILTLISAMFTLAWFQRHNEMTALMAAGVSKLRIVRPVLIAVAAISLVAALNREVLIPQFRDKFSRTTQDLAADAVKKLEPRYDNKTSILLRGRQILTNQAKIQDPNFILPRDLDAYGRHLAGAWAAYLPATDEHPGGYLFEGVKEPKDLANRPSLSLGTEAIVITPHDAAWLQPDQCFVVSDVVFDQLVDSNGWRQFSSTLELIDGLHNRSLDYGADVRVTIHSRLMQPWLDMTLLFLGLPLILRNGNRNMFVAIGLCLLVVIGFMLVVLGFQYLGSSILVSPVTAVWCPLLLFVPLAAWLAEPIWQ